MANSFDSVENLNDYTDVSASSAEIISLSVNSFTNGPLTYYNVIGYAPTSFATLAVDTYVSLSTVNGVSTTTPSNALVIPAGAYITSIILTNNDVAISGDVGTIYVSVDTEINSNIETTIIVNGADVGDINLTGYNHTVTPYVANSSSLYVNVNVDDDVTTGSLCAYITYVMATNSVPPS